MRTLHEIAAEYCDWLEHPEKRTNLIEWLPRILSEMIHVAFHLPDDGMADAGAEGYERPDYQQVRARLPALPLQYYREIFDALDMESPDEMVVGDLYDDLADLYRELAEGLFLHRQVSPAEAERFWGQSFRYHWGEHVTSAVRALYWAQRNQRYDTSPLPSNRNAEKETTDDTDNTDG